MAMVVMVVLVMLARAKVGVVGGCRASKQDVEGTLGSWRRCNVAGTALTDMRSSCDEVKSGGTRSKGVAAVNKRGWDQIRCEVTHK
jgi:hypothetical protein